MNALNSSEIVGEIRRLSGLTQSELALRAGTSQAAVARYESGVSNPSTATLQRLTRAAGFEVRIQLVPVKSSNLRSNRALKLRRKRGEINALIFSAGASNPRIFGSVARGEDTESSDIDLLVDFDVTQGLLPIMELNSKLSKLLGERVEVSPTALLKPSVLESALSEAVPL
jgi:predicted nucleotidyltransferase/DNA-binding XRE family transcriptional regulator